MIDIFWVILLCGLAFGFAGVYVILYREKQSVRSFILITISLIAITLAWSMLIRYKVDTDIMLKMKGYKDTEVDKLIENIKTDTQESYTDDEITEKIYYYLIEYTRFGNYEPLGDDADYYNKIMKERTNQ